MVFQEPSFNQHRGRIEVITGCMFSGKTEELIRRIRRARLAGQKVEIFKPRLDTRHRQDALVTHDQRNMASVPVDSSGKIPLLISWAEVVGIDEAQFFDEGLVQACNEMADKGIRVIAAGLDMDYSGKPFGPMPRLMAVADHVTKVQAICPHCGDPAIYSFRKQEGDCQVMLGDKDLYEPLCRACFTGRRSLKEI